MKGVIIFKSYLFLLLFIINLFLVLYFIYSYCEFYFFKSKQGAKLELKTKKKRGDY